MDIVIGKIERIAVFVSPRQLEAGNIYLVAFADCESNFEERVEDWQKKGAICVYDGPPNQDSSR